MAAAEEDEEDFISFGSALEPAEDKGTSLKKPVPLQDQTVKDEKGRYRRFHGAFTGGFSAGYFNSVGSKEGWTPSTFVSSRQKKAEKQLFSPEHFMDEEDLEEHGIAPKEIVTTGDFASKATDKLQEKSRALASVTGPIPGATILDDLITPAKITIGVQLLRKMGWKEGQGVGPRVKRKAQRQQTGTGVKVYGCSLPDEGWQQSQEERDEEYLPEDVTFAPKDVTPMDFTAKDDRRGLGYSGIDPRRALYGLAREELDSMFYTDSKQSQNLLGDVHSGRERRLGITGQAFGVGALEEEDEDIYARDSLSRYDSVLKEEEPGDGLYGWTAPQQFKKAKGSDLQTGYIGKLLEGFTLGSKSTKSMTVYGPPELPRDYRPVHYFRPVVSPGTVRTTVAQALLESVGQLSTDAATKGRHQLNASQRRELLGERALQGPHSVFDLLAEEDKLRLQEVQRAASHVPSPHPPQPLPSQHSGRGGAAGSSDFKPFVKDAEKQKRYEEYVRKLSSGQSDALATSLDPNMTEWERGREREEFSRAAALYRPISASLSSRFTRAKMADDTDQVEVPEQQEGDVSDKEAAVRMKMFGALTRDKFEWHPDKLLCKRFNVPDPYPGSTVVGLLKVKRDKYSVFNFLTAPTVPASSGMVPARGSEPSNKSSTPESKRRSRWDMSAEDREKGAAGQTLSVAGLETAPESSSTLLRGKDPGDGQGNQPEDKADSEEEESRPSMDLFKAVFASSSEERSSSSSDEEEDEDNSKMEGPPEARDAVEASHQAAPTVDQPGSVKELGFPERGCDGMIRSGQCSLQTAPDTEEFGPRLPPALLHGSAVPGSMRAETHISSTTHQGERERQTHVSSAPHQGERERQKHKDRRKAKKQKKDSKKKHKKHKERRKARGKSPGSSSDEEGGESRPVPIVDLLKRLKNVPLTQH
ncbi:G patch domain-containing protein 1 isoform X2 [Pristis pectinata]|uniref:G patch domain-containing protein 1 isoform X2 n=1 Tax=Pristis pectinata TaxID=685728 RepID=UPI00223D81F4|nr:G patch domain-containing protein 1 isoform X2 [Pristis pectinata]